MIVQNVTPPRSCWFPTPKGVSRMLVHRMSFEGGNPGWGDGTLFITGKLWSVKLKRWSKVDSMTKPLANKFYSTEAEAKMEFMRFRERLIKRRKQQLDAAQADYDKAMALPRYKD